MVYASPVNTLEELRQRIFDAADIIRNKAGIYQKMRFSFIMRTRACVRKEGGHFESII